ncbi:MAG: O-antigen ligase family protein [Terriglobia bacterium]
MAGSYSSRAIERSGELGQIAVETKSLKSTMLGEVLFQMLRVGFLFVAAYGAYYNRPALAWLFGILFVHSLLDRKFYLQPNLMDVYLLFTVVFYYNRWVMGWGADTTTIYKEDAPNWVRAIKDIVWVGFVLAVGVKAMVRGRFDRRVPLWFTPQGLILIVLICTHMGLPVLSMIYGRGSPFQIILWNVRFPLEYIPIVFLLAFILQGQSSIRHLRFFIPLIIISLLFLAVEMFSGRETGFEHGGFYTRYGSIFGSPNDFGVFLMLSITALLAFLAEKAIRWSAKVGALLVLCLCALAGTVSLSAIFAMIFSVIALMLFARNKVKSALTVAVILAFVVGLYFAFPQAGVSKYLSERVESLSSLREGSAYGHYTGAMDVLTEVERFEPAEYLVGTFTRRSDLLNAETYYLRTLYLRGAVSLVTLLSIIALTLFQGYHRYRLAYGNPQRRGLFLAVFLGVGGFTFASLFIPYFETFPSNFYFWFLVAIIWCEPMSEKELSALHAVRPGRQPVPGVENWRQKERPLSQVIRPPAPLRGGRI